MQRLTCFTVFVALLAVSSHAIEIKQNGDVDVSIIKSDVDMYNHGYVDVKTNDKIKQELYTTLDTLPVPAPKFEAETTMPRIRLVENDVTSKPNVVIQGAKTAEARIKIETPETADLIVPARQKVNTSETNVNIQNVNTVTPNIYIQGANTTIPSIKLNTPETQNARIAIEKANTQMLTTVEQQKVQTADFDVKLRAPVTDLPSVKIARPDTNLPAPVIPNAELKVLVAPKYPNVNTSEVNIQDNLIIKKAEETKLKQLDIEKFQTKELINNFPTIERKDITIQQVPEIRKRDMTQNVQAVDVKLEKAVVPELVMRQAPKDFIGVIAERQQPTDMLPSVRANVAEAKLQEFNNMQAPAFKPEMPQEKNFNQDIKVIKQVEAPKLNLQQPVANVPAADIKKIAERTVAAAEIVEIKNKTDFNLVSPKLEAKAPVINAKVIERKEVPEVNAPAIKKVAVPTAETPEIKQVNIERNMPQLQAPEFRQAEIANLREQKIQNAIIPEIVAAKDKTVIPAIKVEQRIENLADLNVPANANREINKVVVPGADKKQTPTFEAQRVDTQAPILAQPKVKQVEAPRVIEQQGIKANTPMVADVRLQDTDIRFNTPDLNQTAVPSVRNPKINQDIANRLKVENTQSAIPAIMTPKTKYGMPALNIPEIDRKKKIDIQDIQENKMENVDFRMADINNRKADFVAIRDNNVDKKIASPKEIEQARFDFADVRENDLREKQFRNVQDNNVDVKFEDVNQIKNTKVKFADVRDNVALDDRIQNVQADKQARYNFNAINADVQNDIQFANVRENKVAERNLDMQASKQVDYDFGNVRDIKNINFNMPSVYSNDSYGYDFANVHDIRMPRTNIQRIDHYNMPDVDIFTSKPRRSFKKIHQPVFEYGRQSPYLVIGDQLSE